MHIMLSLCVSNVVHAFLVFVFFECVPYAFPMFPNAFLYVVLMCCMCFCNVCDIFNFVNV